MTDGRHNLIVEAVVGNIANKATVNFQDIRVDTFQARIARVTRTKIVDRNPTAHFL
ncbi:hypothetical protein D3C71_2167550 [compost metagenome]